MVLFFITLTTYKPKIGDRKMRNSETKHIIASIAFCVIGTMLLAFADLGGIIMPSEILPAPTAGEVFMGLIGLLFFFTGGFYAFIRLGVIYYENLENKQIT